MIFNLSERNEKEILEMVITESGFDYGFVLCSTYDESLDVGNIYNIECINSAVVLETNAFSADEISAPKKKSNKARYILIGKSKDASRPGRMKITKRGKSITSDHNNCISISVANENNGTFNIDGNPDNIDMNNKELNYYKELCLRHNNLLQCAKWAELNDVQKAFIDDENKYLNGVSYYRDKNGDIEIYDNKGKITEKYDIKGDKLI